MNLFDAYFHGTVRLLSSSPLSSLISNLIVQSEIRHQIISFRCQGMIMIRLVTVY